MVAKKGLDILCIFEGLISVGVKSPRGDGRCYNPPEGMGGVTIPPRGWSVLNPPEGKVGWNPPEGVDGVKSPRGEGATRTD